MNVSIIGLGNIGFYYDYRLKKSIQTLSKAFYLSKYFNLRCAIDKNNKTLSLFKSKYPKVKISNNLNYLKEFKSEVLVVSTPTKNHHKVIKSALKIYSPKIIICEKPISYDLKTTTEVISLCKKKKNKIVCKLSKNLKSDIY